MIWEQEIETIVMLTGTTEAGRKKCEQYWPLNQGSRMETREFELTTLSVTIDDPYDTAIRVSKVRVVHLDSGKSRDVTHIQYVEWPDHGVPSTHGFTKLLNVYRTTVEKQQDPTAFKLIHCSAGVGRTGVFVMINIMLDKVGGLLSFGV